MPVEQTMRHGAETPEDGVFDLQGTPVSRRAPSKQRFVQEANARIGVKGKD
jgi:hypothetical protein